MAKNDSAKNLKALRAHMKKLRLDGFLVPSQDRFQSEYTPPSEKRLTWLTGFTGSAGFAVVLEKKAAFFTDGRYTLQAKQEVSSRFEQHLMTTLRPNAWIEKHETKSARIGYDPWLFTPKQLAAFTHGDLVPVTNAVDAVWQNRPLPSEAPAKIHPLAFAGVSSAHKRKLIAKVVKEKKADYVLLTAPDSICWLLNIRGNDVEHTPLLLSYALMDVKGRVTLFCDPLKISLDVKRHLGREITVTKPDNLDAHLRNLANKKILLDPAITAIWFFQTLKKAGAHVVKADDPCQLLKACKNKTEIAGTRQAHVRDGAALCQFFSWLEQESTKRGVDEVEAGERVTAFRAEQKYFQDVSFPPISGYGPNGAIVHYRASKKTGKIISSHSLYLLDSGGQYLDGTTDVTRTLTLGKPSKDQCEHFTRVLKGHIALARAVFPQGTNGTQLDILARQYLWQSGLDYQHGTGHGVGSYLSVHEGPQRIGYGGSDVALKPGMILSNEPGYYREGHYGIRIENLVLIVERKDVRKNFLGFETLTLVPIDTKLIHVALLSEEERAWLNAYHQQVRGKLWKLVDTETQKWLDAATKAI